MKKNKTEKLIPDYTPLDVVKIIATTVTVLLSFIILLSLLFVDNVFAADVTLQWDTNEDAEYYVVYYGTESGNYTQNSENIMAPTVEYTVKGLDNLIWYFSVKAFNSCGNSSDFSDEVIYETIVDLTPKKPEGLKFGQ